MSRVNKVIVTNIGAIKVKYRGNYQKIAVALRAMIDADAKRGIQTRVVALDDAATMKRFGTVAVAAPSDWAETKVAIDAVWRATKPDYLLILGSPDIVAHQELTNPVYAPDDDDDRIVPSDLPYACEHPFSRNIADFRGPTRVVGRLPDICGSADTAYFLKVLGFASLYRQRAPEKYEAYFGLTTRSWIKSTALSLSNIYGNSLALKKSPPSGPRWTRKNLAPLTHFINCHGGSADPKFYGQRRGQYPTAMESSWIASMNFNGTVVAAECCYGAQLYDPSIARGEMGICNRYLGQGAIGFFGSSTIAYGPSEGNGSADLICQFFMLRVLAGSSTGRAAIEARQTFSLQATHLDPTDLKTLAQFNLLGDPSVTPVSKAQHALQKTKVYKGAFDGNAEDVARKLRRNRIRRDGSMLTAMIGFARNRTGVRTSKGVRSALAKAVRDSGLKPGALLSYAVRDPALESIGRRPLSGTTPDAFHLLHGTEDRGLEPPYKPHVVVIATVQDGKLVRLRRLHRRG
jgi:hypothetical protein